MIANTGHVLFRGALIATLFLGAVQGCEKKTTTEVRPTSPPANTTTSTPVKPDNTARNAEDRKTGALNPTDQSNSDADIKITAAIRQKVTADSALSLAAKNCKIITIAGEVTLRGVVDSRNDRELVEKYARDTEGVKKVTNDLEVKAPG